MHIKRQFIFLCFGLFILTTTSCAQIFDNKKEFTRQDSLRGSLNSYRSGWDVLHYDLTVTPDYTAKSITGKIDITYADKNGGHTMQIDLQEPMIIDSIFQEENSISFKKEGNVYWVFVRDSMAKQKVLLGKKNLLIYFHGTPRAAKNAPWDGGWIWKRDEQNRPWMSVAVQGLGASAWYPCKDHQSDEPDSGARLTINVPDSLVAVANGKLISKTINNAIASYTWEVKNPINNYNLIPYIGKYVNFTETYKGEGGNLTCSYWVLDYNVEKAKKQFGQALMTITAFEYWFGTFPWYEDDFKLVEAPHLGMEHQSAVAYGNKFENGYLGSDLSGTGIGKMWDFIIVHEVGHEWFGNNITSKDIADMWVHEGFTSYSEVLFTEYHFGKNAANQYVQGIRKNIQNDAPIIGVYGVQKEGSGDMYYKGSNMLHTIRQVIANDSVFRSILRGLNKNFYHQTVTTKQIEEYISEKSKIDFSTVFDQYLRRKNIPELLLEHDKKGVRFKWNNVVEGFAMPVKLTNGIWLQPTTVWQELKMENASISSITVDPNFYIRIKKEAKKG